MTQWNPVFIGGLANSGKTPLRIALDLSPRISITRKTYLWRRYYGRYGDLGDPENLMAILDTMKRDSNLDQLSPEFERVRAEFVGGRASYCHLFGLLHAHHAERLGKPRWGDQEGLIERFADAIFESWPETRMIHLVRDPRSQVPLRAIQSIGKLGWFTAKWSESADLALTNSSRYPGRYRVIRYEDFAANPEDTVRDVCSFIDEEYSHDMVHAVGDLRDAAGFDQEQGLPVAAARFIEGQAGDRMKPLGYRATAETGRDWPLARPIGLLGVAAWHIVGSRGTAIS